LDIFSLKSFTILCFNLLVQEVLNNDNKQISLGFNLRKILFCILITSLLFVNTSFICESTTFSPDLEIDQSFTYEVITTSLDVSHKREHFVKDEVFQYFLQQFSISNPITISVVNVSDIVINYTLSCQGSNFSRLSPLDPTMLDSYMIVYFNNLLFYPEYIASNFYYDYIEYGNFSSGYLATGLQLDDTLFFISTNNTMWTLLQENLAFIESEDNYNLDDVDFEVETSYLDSNGLIYIEGWFSGVIDYNKVRAFANNGFQLVFNKTSGLLYGVRIKGSYDGVFENFRLTCHTEFHMELLNYDLPEFSLYDYVTPVFGSYMFYFGLVLIPILIIRRKFARK